MLEERTEMKITRFLAIGASLGLLAACSGNKAENNVDANATLATENVDTDLNAADLNATTDLNGTSEVNSTDLNAVNQSDANAATNNSL